MAKIYWTPRSLKGLKAAIDYANENHPKTWVQRLKNTVMALEDAIRANNLITKRKGRVAGTVEIELLQLPFFIVARITKAGDYEFLAFLHKRRKCP